MIVFLERFLFCRASGDDQRHFERIAPGFADGLIVGARLLGNAVKFGNIAFEAEAADAEGSHNAEHQHDEQQPGVLVPAPGGEFGHQSR